MTAAEALRRAADAVNDCAIGERKERVIRLLALHVIRVCGEGENAEEARLLCELLGEKSLGVYPLGIRD
jgi:hypothetical protein